MTDPQKVLVVLTSVWSFYWTHVWAFTCFTCNNKIGEDDTLACQDRAEECDFGATACSTVVFRDFQKKLHVRKFCTPSGTPLYEYLNSFPGSAVCQNIQAQNFAQNQQNRRALRRPRADPARPPSIIPFAPPAPFSHQQQETAERLLISNFTFAPAPPPGGAGAPSSLPLPPAPQDIFMSTLLCVCTKEKCNNGQWQDVLYNGMVNNILDPATRIPLQKFGDKLNRLNDKGSSLFA